MAMPPSALLTTKFQQRCISLVLFSLLCVSIESFSALNSDCGSRRRIPKPFRATTTPPDDDPQQDDNKSENKALISIFEETVQTWTGDKNYKFGDITKRTVSGLTGKDVDTEGYQFGDITKNALTKTGRAILKDNKYQFGDITRAKIHDMERDIVTSTLRDFEQALQDTSASREGDGRQRVKGFSSSSSFISNKALNEFWNRTVHQNMTPQQRRALFIGVVRVAAEALLTWGLFANLCQAAAVSLSWTNTLWHCCSNKSTDLTLPWIPIPGNKFLTEYMWRTFLAKYAAVNMLLSPLFLIIQALGVLCWYQRYHQFVVSLDKRLVSQAVRDRIPAVSKLMVLFAAFVLKNVIVCYGLAFAGMMTGSLWVRLLRPDVSLSLFGS